jgi:RNA-directed DNA polymerase
MNAQLNIDTTLIDRMPTASSQTKEITSWREINWKEIEKYVWRLQQRIYRAELNGQFRKVKQLQRLLLRSKASLLLAIRRVTQINKGKRTAGVDGFKVVTEKDRIKLYNLMKEYSIFCHNPKPARRTYIPKKNKSKLRPLGIPTMKDRVYQCIAKFALEPQWEEKFEPISYGFRPKRGCHDAIEAIFSKLSPGKKQWIFEGDFKGCFDNLNHNYIIEQTKKFPANNILTKWLKAGYVDNGVFNETNAGTPQGGIVSPLLANIALHGMEKEIGIGYRSRTSKKTGEISHIVNECKTRLSMVRYADDFVIMCETKQEAENMYEVLKPYLNKRGLELAPDKTKVTHISEGFDFLGFNVRRYATKKDGRDSSKLLIKPSKGSIQKFKTSIKDTFDICRGTNVGILITKLNPIIIGTANYWRTVVSKEIFSQMDHYIFTKTVKFLRGLHPMKSWKWKKSRYLKSDKYGQSRDLWILTDPVKSLQINKMAWTEIRRHSQIKYKSTPYDSTLTKYFKARAIKLFINNNISLRQKLAKKQDFICPLCGLSIINCEEGLERHHKIPRIKNGTHQFNNQMLVHISCHIDWHRLYPAKGKMIPGQKEINTYRKFREYGRHLEIVFSKH